MLLTLPTPGVLSKCLLTSERVRAAVVAELVRLEVLDRREKSIFFRGDYEYASDLVFLRNRARQLRFAPPLADALRLPPHAQARALLDFNRAHYQYLTCRRDLDPAHGEWYQAEMNATDRLYDVWQAVDDAGREYYYPYIRRQAMMRLRDELIGPDAYYRVRLPPCVPFQIN